MSDFKKRKQGLGSGGSRVVDMRDALRRATEGGTQIIDVELDVLNLDQRLQMRVKGLDEEHVARLQASLEDGGTIDEPVIVFEDSDKVLWLADGYHRVEAHKRAGRTTIVAEIRDGEFESALEYAEEANLKHGLNFSTEDKKRILFSRVDRGYKTNNIEWGVLSNGALASELGVNADTISQWFQEYMTLGNPRVVDRSVVYGRDGREYRTTNLAEANRRRAEEERAAKEAEEKQQTAEHHLMVDRMAFAELERYVNDNPDDLYAKGQLSARRSRIAEVDPSNRRAELAKMTDEQLNSHMMRVGQRHADYSVALTIINQRLTEARRQRMFGSETAPATDPQLTPSPDDAPAGLLLYHVPWIEYDDVDFPTSSAEFCAAIDRLRGLDLGVLKNALRARNKAVEDGFGDSINHLAVLYVSLEQGLDPDDDEFVWVEPSKPEPFRPAVTGNVFGKQPKPVIDPDDEGTQNVATLRQASVEGPAVRLVKEIKALTQQFQNNRNVEICNVLPDGQQIVLIDTLVSVIAHSQTLLAQLGAAEMMQVPTETYQLMWDALDASAKLVQAAYNADIPVPFINEVDCACNALTPFGYWEAQDGN